MSNSIQPTRPTPTDSSDHVNNRWIAGILYVNPENPRLLVSRGSRGWTFNYARPIAWVLTAGILALIGAIIAAALLLPHLLR